MSLDPHGLSTDVDGMIGTIHRLSQLGPALDADIEYLPTIIEMFSLFGQRAGHLAKLSKQWARCVWRRGPAEGEGQP
jgi:hypothetical protein